MRIYIASPYRVPSIVDRVNNVYKSLDAANELLKLGHVPLPPLLAHMWHQYTPKPDEEWIRIGKAWLREQDCVLRLPGQSVGADAEVEYARGRGMSVYYSLKDIPKRP